MSSSYGFGTTIEDSSLGDAAERVTAALAEEGFGILTRIDVRETLQKKLGLEFRPYVILGACNPQLAHRALEAEDQIGLLLPCNVVLQQRGGDVEVSFLDPGVMSQLVEKSEVTEVAKEAEARLRRVMEAL